MIAWHDWEWMGRTKLVAKWYDRLVAEKLRGVRARSDGLLVSDHRTDLTDWPPRERDGFVFCPVNASVNAYYARALAMMSDIARVLGKNADAEAFAREAEHVRRRYNEVFFDEVAGLYVDGEGTGHSSMHVNALALAFDLAPETRASRIADFLTRRGLSPHTPIPSFFCCFTCFKARGLQDRGLPSARGRCTRLCRHCARCTRASSARSSRRRTLTACSRQRRRTCRAWA